jgi:hypothetical protein
MSLKINTVELQRTWEQMKLAFERQARTIWIVNVGDIKGLVCEISKLVVHGNNSIGRKYLQATFSILHMTSACSKNLQAPLGGLLNGLPASLEQINRTALQR